MTKATGENGGTKRGTGRPRGARKPTIMDVARVSGVSYATVSRFLNGNPHVSPEAAERIAAAVRSVNYIPNSAARSLVRQRTQTIAFVMHGDAETITTDPNINTIMVNANRRLGEAGYQLVILIADTDEATARITRLVRSGFADGWILNNLHVDDNLFAVFREANAPVAISGAGYGDQSPFPAVDIDNRAASVELTRYLRAKGHRRIAYLRGPDFIPCSGKRFEGFRETMGGDFDPDLVVDADDWSRASGRAAIRTLLRQLAGAADESTHAGDGIFTATDRTDPAGADGTGNGDGRTDATSVSNMLGGTGHITDHTASGAAPTPTDISGLLRAHGIDAIVAANDCLAAGAMQYLVSRGVRVPQDVAFAGFDDSPDAAAANPPLTTVRQPIGRFGVEMADMVLTQIEGGEAPGVVWLPTEVVPRASA